MKNILFAALLFTSCSNNLYAQSTVKIGHQIWMTKNLDVVKFRNGDPIQQAKTNEEWARAGKEGKPAWCNYDNDSANGIQYGKLYNWFAVNDLRGLAPAGWHVPKDPEWTILTDFLGGIEEAGTKMKSTSGWKKNGNGNNTSGWSGLPGGLSYSNGLFSSIGGYGGWWSSTADDASAAWARNLYYGHVNVAKITFYKEGGYSVRCLRD